MSLAKQDVRKLVDVYISAWTTQDPDLILSVFTPMREVAILELDGDRIASLREYWASERVSS